jgi:hypothetical protein
MGYAASRNKKPVFSILIPSFNDASYIEQCVLSVLTSSRPEFEVILCDDNSEDNSLEIVRRIDDPRIKIFRSENRLGAIANWLNCLNKASGEWVQFLGSDDFYEEGSVDIILDSLNQNGAIYTLPLKCFSDRTKKIIDIQATPEKIQMIFGQSGRESWKGLLKNFNHDELSMTIYPRELVHIFEKLKQESTHSAWIYWVIAIYYKAKIVSLSRGAIMKRYDHIGIRAQWGEVNTDKKNVTAFNLTGCVGDVYNSFILAYHFKDVGLLFDLLFKNRLHETKKGGLYGLMSRNSPYTTLGALVTLVLFPAILIGKTLRDVLK